MTEIATKKGLITEFLNTSKDPKDYHVLESIDKIIEASKTSKEVKPHAGYTAQQRKEAL